MVVAEETLLSFVPGKFPQSLNLSSIVPKLTYVAEREREREREREKFHISPTGMPK